VFGGCFGLVVVSVGRMMTRGWKGGGMEGANYLSWSDETIPPYGWFGYNRCCRRRKESIVTNSHHQTLAADHQTPQKQTTNPKTCEAHATTPRATRECILREEHRLCGERNHRKGEAGQNQQAAHQHQPTTYNINCLGTCSIGSNQRATCHTTSAAASIAQSKRPKHHSQKQRQSALC